MGSSTDVPKIFCEEAGTVRPASPLHSELAREELINAVLSERIEQLITRMEKLESQTLTRWDVALVVGTLAAAVSVVVGATVAVTRYFA